MESKRGGYWLQPHWNSRTWHDATTTTMTPIGFPLARYSHHAPREGQSLSTAARTGSTPARASTRCYPSRGLTHEIVSREGFYARLSLERAQARFSLAEVVSTAVPKELARLLVHVRRHHKGHAVRDWRTKVYPHINALGTFGNLSSLELILFRHMRRLTRQDTPGTAHCLTKRVRKQVIAKKANLFFLQAGGVKMKLNLMVFPKVLSCTMEREEERKEKGGGKREIFIGSGQQLGPHIGAVQKWLIETHRMCPSQHRAPPGGCASQHRSRMGPRRASPPLRVCNVCVSLALLCSQ
jgi:hypothetical protein